MNVTTSVNENTMTVVVDGEINTITTPSLAEKVANLDGIQMLIFDVSRVPYISSAGLRLFLACQRTMMASGGDMVIRHCNDLMWEIFESVGYDRIMKIEKMD